MGLATHLGRNCHWVRGVASAEGITFRRLGHADIISADDCRRIIAVHKRDLKRRQAKAGAVA